MMEKNSIGWQKQPDKLNIQGTIEKAIERITGEQVGEQIEEFMHLGKLQILKQIQIFQ